MSHRRPFGKIRLQLGCLAVWICARGIGLAVMANGVAVLYRVIEVRLVP